MLQCTNSEYDGMLKTTQLIDLDAAMASSMAIRLVHFKNTQKTRLYPVIYNEHLHTQYYCIILHINCWGTSKRQMR